MPVNSSIEMRVAELQERLESRKCTVTQLADGSGVLLDVSGGKVLSLNETAMLLFRWIFEEKMSFDDAVLRLSDAYGIDNQVATRDAGLFIETLHSVQVEAANDS